jgi:hypothetical protein
MWSTETYKVTEIPVHTLYLEGNCYVYKLMVLLLIFSHCVAQRSDFALFCIFQDMSLISYI